MGAEADQTVLLLVGSLLALTGIAALVWLAVAQVKKTSTQARTLGLLVGGAALVAAGVYLATGFDDGEKQAAFEASLQAQAEEMNKSLPRMLDENTRFDLVTVYGTEVHYGNTVVTRTAADLDNALFQNIMYQKLTAEQCYKDEIRAMLNGGVVYRYNYLGMNGGLITSVVISSETCGLR